MPQAIVRPWDTVAVAAAAAAAKNAAAAAAAAASPAPSVSPGGGVPTSTAAEAVAAAAVERRKSSSGGNGSGVNDSPLDALFQMASKTFEGLKAKSGRLNAQGKNDLLKFLGGNLLKRLWNLFSLTSPRLLGQHGSCRTAQRLWSSRKNFYKTFLTSRRPRR